MFQTVGTQFRECGDIKDGVDTVCVGAAEVKTLRPLVHQAIGAVNMIMRDYLERIWNTMNTQMSFGPSGQCCYNHRLN